MKKAILPRMLSPGDLVVLCAPSFAVAEDRVETLEQYWVHYGIRTVRSAHVLARHHAYAGTDDQRLADLQTALDHPLATAIHCVRGGYGIARLLDRLDWSGFILRPKHLIGFSDVTLLLHAAVAAGVSSIHGPMGSHLADPTGGPGQMLHRWVSSGTFDLAWRPTTPSPAQDHNLHFTGTIMGGNLTMLAHLLGSGKDILAGCDILLLEEVGEQYYHIDRLMVQLRRSGCLDGLKAVLLGGFTEMKDTSPAFGFTIYQIVREHVPAHIPILDGLPSGHLEPNYPIPLAVPMQLSVDNQSTHLTALPASALA